MINGHANKNKNNIKLQKEIRLVKEDIIKRDIEKILNCTNSWLEAMGVSTDDDIVKRGGSYYTGRL
jgi:hypothetical protein